MHDLHVFFQFSLEVMWKNKTTKKHGVLHRVQFSSQITSDDNQAKHCHVTGPLFPNIFIMNNIQRKL